MQTPDEPCAVGEMGVVRELQYIRHRVPVADDRLASLLGSVQRLVPSTRAMASASETS